jgi:hypothetical protein
MNYWLEVSCILEVVDFERSVDGDAVSKAVIVVAAMPRKQELYYVDID